jgi:hypothetical protein
VTDPPVAEVEAAARAVSDANYRRLQDSLRKGSWNEAAGHVETLRRAVAQYREVQG